MVGSSGSIVSDYGLDDRAIGVRSPAWEKDFLSNLCFQTDSGAHPASCTMGTGGPFPRAKRGRGVTLTTHPHLIPRSRMSRSYTASTPWRVAGLLCFCNGEVWCSLRGTDWILKYSLNELRFQWLKAKTQRNKSNLSIHYVSYNITTVNTLYGAYLSRYFADKSCPTTRHEDAWGKRRYSSYSFLNSALDGGEWSASRHGRALHPGKNSRYPLYRRLGGPQSWSGHRG
jgi:hypothetical protein